MQGSTSHHHTPPSTECSALLIRLGSSITIHRTQARCRSLQVTYIPRVGDNKHNLVEPRRLFVLSRLTAPRLSARPGYPYNDSVIECHGKKCPPSCFVMPPSDLDAPAAFCTVRTCKFQERPLAN